jgi:hypothetical protein
MNDKTLKNPQVLQQQVLQPVELFAAPVAQLEPQAEAGTVRSRIPLTARNRKVVRVAPPIDDGFRPFRVF